MKHTALMMIVLAALLLCFACAAHPVTETPAPSVVPGASERTPAATPTPTPTTVPTPTPEPTPQTATLGFAGDIALTHRQIKRGLDAETGRYDFGEAIFGMRALFESVDLMCVNLETPLAGAEAGYSGNPKTPNAESRSDAPGAAFNAPDELAYDLKAAGVDFVTTANNHFSDRCLAGTLRTLDVLDAAGLMHAGTYRTEEERRVPCVAEINGIRVGIVAANRVFNRLYDYSRWLDYGMSRLIDREGIKRDIENCRAAGAEFVVVFAHWDVQYQSAPSSTTRSMSKQLLFDGADAVIGTHPHVVQPFEFVTVERENGGTYTGFVAYSLGNCLMPMLTFPNNAGMFVRLTLERGADGTVALREAAYLPTFCTSHRDEAETALIEVVPAYADTTRIPSSIPLSEQDARGAKLARAHVTEICGTDVIALIGDPAKQENG